MTGEEKVAFFEKELERIYDTSIREFTRLCIIHAPDYIFQDCPSSSSGKYHPLDELSWDGTIIHTKKVFTMAYELCRGLDCEHNRDLVLAAALIHDLCKRGWKEISMHTRKDHPAIGAQLVREVQDATQLLSDEQVDIVANCVGYHYGPWSEHPWIKPIDEYTKEELTVYVSDYVVSKRFMTTDFRRDYG